MKPFWKLIRAGKHLVITAGLLKLKSSETIRNHFFTSESSDLSCPAAGCHTKGGMFTKKLELKTLLFFLKSKDCRSVSYAVGLLAGRFGDDTAKILAEMAVCEDLARMRELSSMLVGSLDKSLSLEEVSAILKEVGEGLQMEALPLSTIMDLYHSKEDFLVQKSKEFLVNQFSKYIYKLIYSCYAPYSKDHAEELYQCGVIGLLRAMEGYDEGKGMFTTYCKPFIMHEITMQLNFLNNDTTVHFTSLQKQIREA